MRFANVARGRRPRMATAGQIEFKWGASGTQPVAAQLVLAMLLQAPRNVHARCGDSQGAQRHGPELLERKGGKPSDPTHHPQGEHRIPQVVLDWMLDPMRNV